VGQLSIDAASGLYSGAQRLRYAEADGVSGRTTDLPLVQAFCGSTLAQASNRARLLAWAAHRHQLGSGMPAKGFSPDATHKLLLITVDDPICSSQVFPFFYYQPELSSQLGAQLREVSLKQFEAQPWLTGLEDADTVCFQTWFDRTPAELAAIVAKIRKQSPRARVVYLDWFAPTDLRLAETLHQHVDLYVKKHVFRDRTDYSHATYGDTNLMDFYGKLYDLPHEHQSFSVPSDFYSRMLVGPSFATADYMLPKFLYGSAPSSSNPRPIDLHARISFKGTPWYERMRSEAIAVLDDLSDLKVVNGTGVKRRAYLRELASSKLCFSPFGYGEVCWRDYEAVMCGSLLLKPDMSHVETNPDIFRAGETYVPLRWDFSDLEQKTRYYLAHPEERARITRNAFMTLQKYFREQGFLEHMRSVLDPLPANGLDLGLERLSGVQLCVGAQTSTPPESASA
jgi:hypothetical protein